MKPLLIPGVVILVVVTFLLKYTSARPAVPHPRPEPPPAAPGRLESSPADQPPSPCPAPNEQPGSRPGAPPSPRPLPPRGEIRVEFDTDTVRIESGHDVSNVVLEYDDATRQRFEDLTGRRVQLRGTGRHQGKAIARAWVKAGPNLSGDGPGYGTRFDRPIRGEK